MITEYFWVSTTIIIVFSFLVWYFCNYNQQQKSYININNIEYFEPKWVSTLKSLNFTNEDLNNFIKQLNDSNDPNELLSKIVSISSKKGLTDEKIFKSLVDGETKEEFTFSPSNPFEQLFAEL
jgi:hypothetical protein